MKTLALCLSTMLAIITTSYAQNTPWPASGNVGIGTTSPGAKLEIAVPTNGADGLQISRPGSPTWQLMNYGPFYIQEAGIGPRLAVAPGGNVGIGTAAPRGKLDINGTTVIHNGLIQHVLPDLVGPQNGSESYRNEIGRMGVNQHHWGASGVITIELFQTSFSAGAYQKWYVMAGYQNFAGSAKLVEQYGYSQYARVTLGDPVLTGTSYAGYPNQYIPIYVDVSYYSNWRIKITHCWNLTDSAVPENSQFKFFDAPSQTTVSGVATAPATESEICGNQSVTGSLGIGGVSNPSTPLVVNGGPQGTAGWNKTSTLQAVYPVQIFNSNGTKWAGMGYDFGVGLKFWVNGSSDDLAGTGLLGLTLLNNGNFGVGTASPSEKLSVNGKIRAKEVIVETTGWSDHVFADSYQLLSLSEVEQHIKTEKHLPGVPSAQEVAAKGVSVGDMQAILLAKIEEITLHQIAQEKELAALRTEVTTLKAENTQLKAQNK